jgi:hypothetical protein
LTIHDAKYDSNNGNAIRYGELKVKPHTHRKRKLQCVGLTSGVVCC